ncbi:MAG: phosphoglucosamine mutase [Desulfobacterales bacterium]|nr:phosphoglucosamine mutase [Desulfobacterales bacterium]
MKRLFGTDGIRGMVNEYPMTPELIQKLGKAIALFCIQENDNKDNHPLHVVIGRDTRISGQMLESALISGLCSMGIHVYLAGIIPTPAIALLTRHQKACLGIVISASHNPYHDNGIKLFQSNGYKLSEDKEAVIEQFVFDNSEQKTKNDPGLVFTLDNAEQIYLEFLIQAFYCQRKNFHVIMDCSNGAMFRVAPKLYQHLGFHSETLHVTPNGKNINLFCGSEYPEELAKKVVETHADVGFAFDGDGDRMIAIDEKGNIITGDQILSVCSWFAKKNGKLNNNTVVSTVMSNAGLTAFLTDLEINHVKSQIGDRHVLETMLSYGATIGGEDSGHMIFLDTHTTGDGLLSSLRLLDVLSESSEPLSSFTKKMSVFPQVLMNVEVTQKIELSSIPEINQLIEDIKAKLGSKGRILLRYSGTQPLCRVMVEGPTQEETHQYCKRIADTIKNAIGVA